MDECIHGLGPVSACVICNGRETQEKAARDAVLYEFSASFAGRLVCGHEVDLGERLSRLGDGRIVCEDCAP